MYEAKTFLRSVKALCNTMVKRYAITQERNVALSLQWYNAFGADLWISAASE